MATSGQIPSDITLAAGEALRRNAGNSAFEAFTPGSGGGVTIGDAVSGGTAGRVLYIDSTGDLADNTNLKFVETDGMGNIDTLQVKKIHGKASAGNGTSMTVNGGWAASGSNGNGGTLVLKPGQLDGSGTYGEVQLGGTGGTQEVVIMGGAGGNVYLDTSISTSDRTISFPNQDGVMLLYKTITLTGTQITGMGTTSGISLISAVSGKTICPVSCWAKATSGTVYTGGTNTTWGLNYSATRSTTDDPFVTGTIAPATYTASGFLIQMTPGGIQGTSKYENTALYLTTSFQWGGGHSSNTVVIVIAYYLM